MWAIFEAIPPLARIADKLIPTRKQRLRNKLQKLQEAYKKALLENNDVWAARIDNRMRQLRKRVGDL